VSRNIFNEGMTLPNVILREINLEAHPGWAWKGTKWKHQTKAGDSETVTWGGKKAVSRNIPEVEPNWSPIVCGKSQQFVT
jgi:hypothetical protein